MHLLPDRNRSIGRASTHSENRPAQTGYHLAPPVGEQQRWHDVSIAQRQPTPRQKTISSKERAQRGCVKNRREILRLFRVVQSAAACTENYAAQRRYLRRLAPSVRPPPAAEDKYNTPPSANSIRHLRMFVPPLRKTVRTQSVDSAYFVVYILHFVKYILHLQCIRIHVS